MVNLRIEPALCHLFSLLGKKGSWEYLELYIRIQVMVKIYY